MKSHSPVKPASESEPKLKIIIRMRPILNEEDSDQFVHLEDDNTLYLKKPSNHTYMKFNNILPPDSTQKDVFVLVEDSIREFLEGKSVTIFAYGQTGAGKTYTIIGNYSERDSQQNLFNFLSSRDRGILSRSLEIVLGFTQKHKGYKILVSFFQIYNEKIFDLCNNTTTPLEVRESKQGEVTIPQLLNVEVQSMQQVLQFLMVGLRNRATGSTHENAQSSRSHSIFQIKLQKTNPNGQTKLCTLRIVDLAGSEKFKIPSNLHQTQKQIRIQELTSINGSLSCLGHCISALIEKQRKHIPFRNSKLTRILSDSLIGNGKLRFVICISPSLSSSAETFSTLQFANRAKKAIFERVSPRATTPIKKESSNLQIKQLRAELELERRIRLGLEKELACKTRPESESLIIENGDLRRQNEGLRAQLKVLKARQSNRQCISPAVSQPVGDCSFKKVVEKRQLLKQEMLNLPIFHNKFTADTLSMKQYFKKENQDKILDQKILQMLQKTSCYSNTKQEQKKNVPKSLRSQSRTQTQIRHSTSVGMWHGNQSSIIHKKKVRHSSKENMYSKYI